MNTKLLTKIRKLHRWLAFIVGIQLLIWTASGLYMTAVPLHMVHGKHLITPISPELISTNAPLYSVAELIKKHSTLNSIELVNVAGQLVYIAKEPKGTFVYDAKTGSVNPKVSSDKAKEIALERYTGTGVVSSVVQINNAKDAPEIGGRATPLWQVNFADWVNTSIYVSNSLEQVVTVRSDIWRVFDFFWMLHIMDYSERENFNNPLVIFMSTLGCFIALSGLLLFVSGMQKNRRFLR